MKQLLGKTQNNFFSEYKIIVAAGAEAGMGLDALTAYSGDRDHSI